MIIVEENRCESCHEPTGNPIGSICPADCQYSRVVLAIACDRYCVEIAAGKHDFRCDGFIGKALSREFSGKHYVKLETARVKAIEWLERKCQD